MNNKNYGEIHYLWYFIPHKEIQIKYKKCTSFCCNANFLGLFIKMGFSIFFKFENSNLFLKLWISDFEHLKIIYLAFLFTTIIHSFNQVEEQKCMFLKEMEREKQCTLIRLLVESTSSAMA